MQVPHGTRQQILQFLQGMQGISIGELAQRLGLAPATVRRHLDILQRDRLVAYRLARKPTGRPEHVYFLTEDGHEALPKAYASLLASLINEIASLDVRDVQESSGRQLLEVAFRALAQQVASAARQKGTKDGKDPLAWLLRVLEEEGFRPQVERQGDGLSVRLFNCPFRSVALADEAICSFDRELIASVFQGQVTREACIRQGDSLCCYKAALPSQSLSHTAVPPASVLTA